ncbi:MAG: hypothetical protein KDA57_19565 [Planctomycetales bacterium]|nr:hypothetical protein [Planctomycetales bacterium]
MKRVLVILLTTWLAMVAQSAVADENCGSWKKENGRLVQELNATATALRQANRDIEVLREQVERLSVEAQRLQKIMKMYE